MVNKKKKPTVLTRRSDFLNTQKNGRRLHPRPWMTVNVAKNQLDEMRYGWTIPRFVGSAVTRNRLKRWLREMVRQYENVSAGRPGNTYDVNFVLRRQGKEFYRNLRYDEFKESLLRLFCSLDRMR